MPFKNIIFNSLLLPVVFLCQSCSNDVDFSRPQGLLKECADETAVECRTAEPGLTFKETFVIAEQPKKKSDILFIVDTSGSMVYEQEHIRERFGTFIDSLENVDWRVAIATAIIHPLAEYAGSGGSLIPFAKAPGAPLFLDESIPGAHEYFSQTIRRPKSCALKKHVDDCDDHERAIYQANLLIDNRDTIGFFRPGADVSIVIVSDEDEKSNGKDLEAQDIPETLIANAANLQANSFTVHSIINRPDDKSCFKGQGEGYGNVYKRIADLTKGVIGNVCDDDYSDQLKTIAGTITAAAQTIDLPCVLQEPPIVSTAPVLDKSFKFTIRDNKIAFNKALPGSTQIFVEGVCRPK